MNAPLRLGTRASQLALTQSRAVGERLVAGGDRELELVHVRSQGDVDRTSPLARIGGTGVFVTAVRQALLDGEVDVIVHSCKDLPTAGAEGISLRCVPSREDPRDALCARDDLTLERLPHGARVGTGSPRRAAQLLRARPDLEVVAIRGNVETRLARALGEEADLHAVVLAASGLRRVGREAVISELLPLSVMLPAPAQGALAVETVEEPAAWLAEALDAAEDPATRAAVTAERSLLRTLEAGCSAPVAAHAELSAEEDRLILRALAISHDGAQVVEGTLEGPADDAAVIGRDLASDLLSRGADSILAAAGIVPGESAARDGDARS